MMRITRVVATANKTASCFVARYNADIYVSYPHSIIPYEEAMYIGLRFGHLVVNEGREGGVFGPELAFEARREMLLISEDVVSLSLLDCTVRDWCLHLQVFARVTDGVSCWVYRVDEGMGICIEYPRSVISRSEAKYIAARFGHLTPTNGMRMSGPVLAQRARMKMRLVLEDLVSLSLLDQTV